MTKKKCNRAAKQEKRFPSLGGLITYKRRCSRTSNSFSQENGLVPAQELLEVVDRNRLLKLEFRRKKEEEVEGRNCNEEKSNVDSGRADIHWKNVLEHMLQLTDVSSHGGINDCITNALIYLPSRNGLRPYMTDVTKDSPEPKDRYTHHRYNTRTKPETKIHKQTDADANKTKCQKTFVKILCSEEFNLLCNLLCEGIKVEKLFDTKHLDSKMKSGVYGQSPGMFFDDLQQIWDNFSRVGEEMVILARSLSNMSKGISQQGCTVDSAAKHSDVSISGSQFIQSCDSVVPSAKLNQIEPPALQKPCKCKTCGLKADAKTSLMCDECDAAYHPSCLKPPVQDIPTKSWYCDSCCNSNKETTTATTRSSRDQTVPGAVGEKNPHGNCTVCDRLDVVAEPKESSTSSMVADEAPEISRTALSRLCKQCGTCEDEDKRFLICGHAQCPYKYYHIRCLRTGQVAGHQQGNRQCWYCPSCLCRGCLVDRDDESIVLCDGCDEAHHIYCMKPPRASVPRGQWYCLHCNVEKARQGMRRYEQWVLQHHGKKKPG